MQLLEFVRLAALPPEPWKEGRTIPWDDPGFSARMLKEHLSSQHDAASRRGELIDRHIAFLEEVALPSAPARVLDLGCGPGLYLHRLAARGHEGVGIDFGPASIDYARREAGNARLRFELGDIRSVEFGSGYDLAMLVYGELNLFPREEAVELLRRCAVSLKPGGKVLLEVHSFDKVRQLGTASSTWRVQDTGLFSDRPHLRLDQAFWLDDRACATGRYWILDAASSEITKYGWTNKAYTEDEYIALLADAGLALTRRFGDLTGGEAESDFPVLLAEPR